MSTKDERSAFLETASVRDEPLIVEVPSAPPVLHRQHRSGLARPYRGVGVESEGFEGERLGIVWQYWFMLGAAIAFIMPAGIGMLVMGEWMIVLAVSPIVGLFLVGVVRSLLAEQKAKKKKRIKRLRH